jgi:hypothetical protein
MNYRLVTSASAKIAVLHMGFEFVAEPHGFRRVESRQKISQVLYNDVPKSNVKQ